MNPLIRFVFCASILFFWVLHINDHRLGLTWFVIKSACFSPRIDPVAQNISWVFDEVIHHHLHIPPISKNAIHPKLPNIVLIIADDLGFYDLHGSHEAFTANLRSIGEQGIYC